MPAGRPLKYKTLLELQTIIDTYFAECDPHWVNEEYWDYPFIEGEELEPQEHGGALKRTRKRDYDTEMVMFTRRAMTKQEPYTMAGLARHLGMERHGLMEYNARDQFSSAIKEARSKVGEYNERMLHLGKNSTGAIFNLKVNFGYRENIEENPPPENPIVFINAIPITPDEPA